MELGKSILDDFQELIKKQNEEVKKSNPRLRKSKKVSKWRAKNKTARKSRRINRLRVAQ